MAKRILIQQTSAGEPVQVGEARVYPVARSYMVNFPGGRGGIAWNKPLAVIVEDSQANQINVRSDALQAVTAAGHDACHV